MTHIEAIRAELADSPAVDALVGYSKDGNRDHRIYPQRAPQGAAAPYIVLQVVSDVPTITMEVAAERWRKARVQVDCYGRTYLEVHQVAAAVDAALAIARPSLAVLPLNATDDFDDEAALHRVRMDFSVMR